MNQKNSHFISLLFKNQWLWLWSPQPRQTQVCVCTRRAKKKKESNLAQEPRRCHREVASGPSFPRVPCHYSLMTQSLRVFVLLSSLCVCIFKLTRWSLFYFEEDFSLKKKAFRVLAQSVCFALVCYNCSALISVWRVNGPNQIFKLN